MSLHHEDDILVDTRFGRALALWRLTARALIAAKMREPEMSPYGIQAGGEDEAWIYREQMLETWRATPAALEFLAGVPLPEPPDARQRPGSRGGKGRAKSKGQG